MNKKPVIAIGLDAADPKIVEQWMDQGYLPTLSRLRDRGVYSLVQNFEHYRAETPWTTFLTGAAPDQIGYWSPIKFFPQTYDAKLVEAYDFQEFPPFYALGDEFKVAAFDLPHAEIVNNVNGLQVTAWGAHSPQGPSASAPAELFQEIVTKHGVHPGLHNDHASCFDLPALEKLQEILETGIARRAQICQDLLQRENWDLFITVFGETHAAGHFMWHLSQTDHPLYEVYKHTQTPDRMLTVFQAIDRAIDEILQAAPADAQIVIFSPHGMGTNIMDLPSGTFLPELLYRWSFPGKVGIAEGNVNDPVPAPITQCQKNSWLWEVWSTKSDRNPLRKRMRRHLPYKVFKRLEPLLGKASEPDLVSPHHLTEQRNPMDFQPAEWYKPCWSAMKAFALPSFSEGYIRLNVQGREANGIVAPEDFSATCDEIITKLYALRDAHTGVCMVKDVIRMRQNANEDDPRLPDADLVVIWQEEHAADTVDSDEFGRIGPVPHFRTGSHRSQGFFIAAGSEIPIGKTLPMGHALDLTPTLLALMGAPIPNTYHGRSLLTPVTSL